LNTEQLKQLLQTHQTHEDNSTLAKACLFNITYPSDDLFLVIRVEKCLQQGDIGECAEPYVKAAQSGQSASQVEKLAANASQFCERLGKYRMPFVWTAINVMTILNNNQQGVNEIGTMANINNNNSNGSGNNSGGSGGGGGGETTASSKASSLDRRGANAQMMMTQNGGGKGNSNTSSIASSSAYGLKNAYESFRKVRFVSRRFIKKTKLNFSKKKTNFKKKNKGHNCCNV
jgi:hypothetical protein